MNHKKKIDLDRLFAAARGFRPDTAAGEGHFETRLMARIREKRSARSSWSGWAWRLAPAFAVLAVALGAANLLMEANHSPDIFATMVNGHENQLLVSYLMGR